MEIKYLIQLNNHPTVNGSMTPGRYSPKTLEPIPMSEILSLESTYNNGKPFPAALRELLFLAGNYCYILDYNIYDSQEEMQATCREELTNEGKTINRPFYVIEHGTTDDVTFVYLDEGDNPIVHHARLDGGINKPGWLNNTSISLSELLNRRLQSLLKGYNPM